MIGYLLIGIGVTVLITVSGMFNDPLSCADNAPSTDHSPLLSLSVLGYLDLNLDLSLWFSKYSLALPSWIKLESHTTAQYTFNELVAYHNNYHYCLLMVLSSWLVLLTLIFIASVMHSYEAWLRNKMSKWPWFIRYLDASVAIRDPLIKVSIYVMLPEIAVMVYVAYFLFMNPIAISSS